MITGTPRKPDANTSVIPLVTTPEIDTLCPGRLGNLLFSQVANRKTSRSSMPTMIRKTKSRISRGTRLKYPSGISCLRELWTPAQVSYYLLGIRSERETVSAIGGDKSLYHSLTVKGE